MSHRVETCRIPLSAVAAYYRRNLQVRPGAPTRHIAPDRIVPVDVGSGPGGDGVVVAIVGFAAHVAYLEPATGTGFLVLPAESTDILSEDGFAGVSWPLMWSDCPGVGLSLQAADLARALERLSAAGWTLLEDDHGNCEIAGETADGRRAVCLYAKRSSYDEIFLEDLHRAVAALHTAADLRHQ